MLGTKCPTDEIYYIYGCIFHTEHNFSEGTSSPAYLYDALLTSIQFHTQY